jgi:hypothetical protein
MGASSSRSRAATEQGFLRSTESVKLDVKVLCVDIKKNLAEDYSRYADTHKRAERYVQGEEAVFREEFVRQEAVGRIRSWLQEKGDVAVSASLDRCLRDAKGQFALNYYEQQMDLSIPGDMFNPFYSDELIRGIARFIIEREAAAPGSFKLIYDILKWKYSPYQ